MRAWHHNDALPTEKFAIHDLRNVFMLERRQDACRLLAARLVSASLQQGLDRTFHFLISAFADVLMLDAPVAIDHIGGRPVLVAVGMFAGSAGIELSAAGERISIAVRDCGPGIPEQKQAAVPQPFYRLESSRYRNRRQRSRPGDCTAALYGTRRHARHLEP